MKNFLITLYLTHMTAKSLMAFALPAAPTETIGTVVYVDNQIVLVESDRERTRYRRERNGEKLPLATGQTVRILHTSQATILKTIE